MYLTQVEINAIQRDSKARAQKENDENRQHLADLAKKQKQEQYIASLETRLNAIGPIVDGILAQHNRAIDNHHVIRGAVAFVALVSIVGMPIADMALPTSDKIYRKIAKRLTAQEISHIKELASLVELIHNNNALPMVGLRYLKGKRNSGILPT